MIHERLVHALSSQGDTIMPPRKKQKDVAADHVDEAPGAPKTVATVKPKRVIRGRRGFLKDIPNLPLDVLLEASLSSCIMMPVSRPAFAHLSRSFSASCTRATS